MVAQFLHLPLSPFDHVPPRSHAKSLFYFALKDNVAFSDAFSVLEQGLAKTFADLPWLRGNVHHLSKDAPGYRPGQLEIRYPQRSDHDASSALPELKYKELDSCFSYADIKESGFPVDLFADDELHTGPSWADVDSGAPVFEVQANFLRGGCLLCISMCHAVADGGGIVGILKLWGAYCSQIGAEGPNRPVLHGLHTETLLPEKCADRSILELIWKKERTQHSKEEMDPAAWEIVGLEGVGPRASKGSSEAAPSAPAVPRKPGAVQKSSIFYTSPEQFEALQKSCAEEQDSHEISRNDVLCGLIWRSVIRARAAVLSDQALAANAESQIVMTVDGREEFSHSLPRDYLGNLVVGTLPTLTVSQLVASGTTVAMVAQTIRDRAKAISHTNLMDSFTLLHDEIRDYGVISLPFTSIEGWSMLVTSVLGMKVDEVSFGDAVFKDQGHVGAYRPLMDGFNSMFRISVVLPRMKHGGVEFIISLFDDEMDVLLQDEEFAKFATQL